jgi:hypothetical protein
MKVCLVIFSLFLCSTIFSQGWQSLFDGKTLNGWKQMTGKAEYKVEDGAIVGTAVAYSPNSFLVCDKKFSGDLVLELEAMMTDTSGNSGVQFKSNFDAAGNKGAGRIYGYQFEMDPSSRRWSGGVYEEGRREWLYPGSLNAKAQVYFTPNVYHKIKIECIGNSVKTWLDGKAVAYVVDTITANEGLIGLQVHAISNEKQKGSKMYWKNIRIKTSGIVPSPFPKGIYVTNLQPNTLSDYEKKDGWKLLFDGKTTNGWIGAYKKTFPEKGWEIKDGILRVLPSDGNLDGGGGDIVTAEKFGAFDLSFDFKLAPGANSGVKYFVTLPDNTNGYALGLEYQLIDDSLHPDAKLGRDGNHTLASLFDLIKAEKTTRFIHQPGKWNTARIIVYPNNHVEHYLNGIKVLEYEKGSSSFNELVAMSKFKVYDHFVENKKGLILLQDHGDEISFRNIKIKNLN